MSTLPSTIHYTELAPAKPGSHLEVEWNTYRQEVGRLLAEGNEGKWVLIKGDQIIGVYDTRDEASDEGRRRYPLQGYLVHHIQTRERIRYPWPAAKWSAPVHYTELAPAQPGSHLAEEWNTYLREVGRLLAEGNEGKWVLMKGEQTIGVYDTRDEASDEGRRRYLLQAYLVHQIQTRERIAYIWQRP